MNEQWLLGPALVVLVVILVAIAPRLLHWLATSLAYNCTRNLQADLKRRVAKLNRERRVRGLGRFPSFVEFERMTLRYTRELMPEGAGQSRTEPWYNDTLDITFEGVVVLGDLQPSPELPGVHLGEFVQHVDPVSQHLASIGSGHHWRVSWGIIIYYVSFMHVFAAASREVIISELRHTIAHELRHLLDEEEHVPLRNSLAWTDLKRHHRWRRWLEENEEVTNE